MLNLFQRLKGRPQHEEQRQGTDVPHYSSLMAQLERKKQREEAYEEGRRQGYAEGRAKDDDVYEEGKRVGYVQGFEEGESESNYELEQTIQNLRTELERAYEEGYEQALFDQQHKEGQTRDDGQERAALSSERRVDIYRMDRAKGYEEGYKRDYEQGQREGYMRGSSEALEQARAEPLRDFSSQKHEEIEHQFQAAEEGHRKGHEEGKAVTSGEFHSLRANLQQDIANLRAELHEVKKRSGR